MSVNEHNNKISISSNAPTFKIKGKEHFWVQGLKRDFNLEGVIPIYVHVQKNKQHIQPGVPIEFSIGFATIVFSLNKEKDTITLITGWVGNRKRQ